MAVAFDTLRTGKYYRLTNYGEVNEFEVLRITDQDIYVKDLNSLETYPLSLLVKYGRGDDYELYELEK